MESDNWLEIRPLPSGKFAPKNFAWALDYLYNTGLPFRFFMANFPSSKIEGLRNIRFFLQLPTAELAERIADTMRMSLDVEVIIGSAPPACLYEQCMEFSLKSHYALPICHHRETNDNNPLDVIASALSRGENVAFEVLAVGDRKARMGILQYIWKRTGKTASFTDSFVDALIEFIDAISQRKTSKSKLELDPFVKERVEAASWKLNKNLFRCEVRAYGDSLSVQAVGDSLPFAFNGLRGSRLCRLVEAPPERLRVPGSRKAAAAIMSFLWVIPLLLLPVTFMYGLFKPFRLANIDIIIVVAAVASAAILYALFKKPPPLVLCTDELSLIVGLPSAVDKLPVETGMAKVTRRQFAFGEDIARTSDLTSRAGNPAPSGVG